MNDKPDVTQCGRPNCNKSAKRIFDATPVQFKGSGFYTTDRK